MKSGKLIVTVLLLGIAVLQSPVTAQGPANTGSAMVLIADRLAADQLIDGPNAGSWAEETGLTGSIVMGLAAAYDGRCHLAFREAAELAGAFINESTGKYYGLGDDAMAMAMLSSISANPQNNAYRSDLESFYEDVSAQEGGAAGFVSYYNTGTEPSIAVFYLALHTVASDYVDAAEKTVFREALIDYLALVDDDTAQWPVLALGMATWALSSTGQLDDTPVDAYGTGQPYWFLITLADLPGILLSHQATDHGVAGSFYWRFDHTDGLGNADAVTNGYTEDAIAGSLGLAGAAKQDASLDLGDAIAAARAALLSGVNPDGTVYGHLSEDSPDMKVYAGEMLFALKELAADGDSNLDDAVNVTDLEKLANYWLGSCNDDCWCRTADTNGDGVANLADFAALAANWLDGI